MRKVLISILVLFVCGCSVVERHDREQEEAKYATYEKDLINAVKHISYYKDNKTGICFAFIFSTTAYYFRPASFTAVPCEKIPKK